MWPFTRCVTVSLLVLVCATSAAQSPVFLEIDGEPQFPIGFYELPGDDAALAAMADAGVNIVRCRSAADLDRAKAAGMVGWVSVPVQTGVSGRVKDLVAEVKDHPALAVWEGPDEIVWHFTASSRLEDKVGITRSDWWSQQDNAVEYAREQAAEIMPKINAGIDYIRTEDTRDLPVWFNEARKSDVKFVRMYLDNVDVIGCDDYPIRRNKRDVHQVGRATQRWVGMARGHSVWMVLQAFSWSELNRPGKKPEPAYPSFAESRFMAYDCIAHGAGGLLYWGSHYLESDAMRTAVYAVCRELAALNPFLTGTVLPAAVTLIEAPDDPVRYPVVAFARQHGDDALVVVVNDDTKRHLGVEVAGLEAFDGRHLMRLYGDETATVRHGTIVTRMQPRTVKVFCTSKDWAVADTTGRGYEGE